ncbi:MAG: cyclic nucleotide-binding domain-containing protein [Myxococcota bacterium]
MPTLSEAVQVFARTDPGRKRSHNEDSVFVDPRLGLFIVADGMGGHAAGEVASALAVETIRSILESKRDRLRAWGHDGDAEASTREILGILEFAVKEASQRIHVAASEDKGKRGMGTTVSVLLLLRSMAFIAHVGDSRIYLIRQGQASSVTEDHTIANELIKAGVVTPDRIKLVPRRNAITRAVGVYEHVDVDTLTVELLPKDQFVLCSDGLSGYLDDDEPGRLISMLQDENGDRVVQGLIDYANQLGGKDNITAILVQTGAGDAQDSVRARRLALKRDALLALPLFSRLDERELLRVMQVAEVYQYQPGDQIVVEGEAGDRMFVALDGRLEVRSGDQVLSELGPGDHFGEMSLIRQRARSATVHAVDSAEVLSISRDDFFDILRHEHRIAVKLLWQFVGVLANRLERTSKTLSHLRDGVMREESVISIDEEPSLDPFAAFDLSDAPWSSQPKPRTIPGLDDHAASLGGGEAAMVLPTGEERQRLAPSFDEAPAMAERVHTPPLPTPRLHRPDVEARHPGIDPQDEEGAPFDARATQRLRRADLASLGRRSGGETAPRPPPRETVPDGLKRTRPSHSETMPSKFKRGAGSGTLPMNPEPEVAEEVANVREEFRRELEARRARKKGAGDEESEP